MSSLYEHIPHPHVHARRAAGPVKVADQHPTGNPFARANTKLALGITKVVGSMWCAYVFGLMDLFSLPDAIRGGAGTLIGWIAQTFLQLVLLSIIMVGQNVQADAADSRAEATYHDVTASAARERATAGPPRRPGQAADEDGGEARPRPGPGDRPAGGPGGPGRTGGQRAGGFRGPEGRRAGPAETAAA